MVKISEKVKEYLSLPEKVTVLSTSDKEGKNNVGMYGSFMLKDDSTLLVMFGDNRSYANIRENPHAALLVVAPGGTGLQTEGCRLYLKMRSAEDSGEMFDKIKGGIRASIGDGAEILKHLVTFDILETRPIVDMGQGV